MSNGMISTTSPEADEYCDAVRAALADLAGEIRDDLLEDLPDHLSEVLAEGEGSLRERLGEPAAYAEELRAAAGLEPAPLEASVRTGWARAADALERAGQLAGRLDVRIGRLVGYPRLVELLRAARPGWWVLRGWIVAQFLCGARDRVELVPSLGGNTTAGLGLTLAVIAASVWLGQRSLGFSAWPRRLMIAASVVVAVWAVTGLHSSGATNYGYVSPPPFGYGGGSDVTDVYVYDTNGKPVDSARLFDQNGRPIQLGSPTCQDGSLAPGAGTSDINAGGSGDVWTYPLCPRDPGPFRSGPGLVPPTISGSAPASGDTVPTTRPSATSTATAKPTRSR